MKRFDKIEGLEKSACDGTVEVEGHPLMFWLRDTGRGIPVQIGEEIFHFSDMRMMHASATQYKIGVTYSFNLYAEIGGCARYIGEFTNSILFHSTDSELYAARRKKDFQRRLSSVVASRVMGTTNNPFYYTSHSDIESYIYDAIEELKELEVKKLFASHHVSAAIYNACQSIERLAQGAEKIGVFETAEDLREIAAQLREFRKNNKETTVCALNVVRTLVWAAQIFRQSAVAVSLAQCKSEIKWFIRPITKKGIKGALSTWSGHDSEEEAYEVSTSLAAAVKNYEKNFDGFPWVLESGSVVFIETSARGIRFDVFDKNGKHLFGEARGWEGEETGESVQDAYLTRISTEGEWWVK
jgi:hypothetical protein